MEFFNWCIIIFNFLNNPIDSNSIANPPRLFSALILNNTLNKYYNCNNGGARGVMAIVVGNGHSDTSSNPGPG